MARLELADIPELEGWVSVARVAEAFKCTKESVYYMIHEQGLFRGVRRIGGDPADPSGKKRRAYLLIPQGEFERVRAERSAKQPPFTTQISEWHKRVKQWGRQNEYFSGESGRPNQALIAAYQDTHPDDPRPTREQRGPAYDFHHPGRDSRE